LSSSTATTTSAPTTATSTSATGATPSPTQVSYSKTTQSFSTTNETEQKGMASGCIRFYYVEANNDCYDIPLDAGVALYDFYTRNPTVKSGCSGLQSGIFVCIGKTGYATLSLAVIQFPQLQRQHR
jgi:hypothetical protein